MSDLPGSSSPEDAVEGEPSEVLHKLDQLLNKYRPGHDDPAQVPTLTETLEDTDHADIPVLLDEATHAGTPPRSPVVRLERQHITRVELQLCQVLRHQLEQAVLDSSGTFSAEAQTSLQTALDGVMRKLPATVHRAMLDALATLKKD